MYKMFAKLNVFVIKNKIYGKICIVKNCYPVALWMFSEALCSVILKQTQKVIFIYL